MRKKSKDNKKTIITILVIAILILGMPLLMKLAKKKNWGSWQMGPGSDLPIMSNEVALCEKMAVKNYNAFPYRLIVVLDVFAKAVDGKRDQLDTLVGQHDLEIKDRIRCVVASANREQFTDPQLKLVRNEITTNVEEIVGKGLFTDILIPVWNVADKIVPKEFAAR